MHLTEENLPCELSGKHNNHLRSSRSPSQVLLFSVFPKWGRGVAVEEDSAGHIASGNAISAVLTQLHNSQEQVVAYFS